MPRPKNAAHTRFAAARAKNPFFARAAVNRLWAGFFATGFINPLDDIRPDSVASHPEALDLLRHLRRSGKTKEEICIHPADPLNLTGVILPGARTGSLTQGVLRLIDGVPAEPPSESAVSA